MTVAHMWFNDQVKETDTTEDQSGGKIDYRGKPNYKTLFFF